MQFFSAILKTVGLFMALSWASKNGAVGLNGLSLGVTLMAISWYVLYWNRHEN